MKVTIAIPARYGSSRFLGKPLVRVNGISMLERVWRIAKSVKNATDVIICTEDQRIIDEASKFEAKVVLTSEKCRNGTERILEALNTLREKPDVVINLQGDAILTPPWIIENLIDAFIKVKNLKIGTTAVRLDIENFNKMKKSKTNGQAGGTFVVSSLSGNALYFSKSPIPFLRNKISSPLPIFRHIGLYGYNYETLVKYNELSPTPLEITEGLEQLRALEHDIPIKVIEVDYQGRSHWSIDSPEDVNIVEELINKEGELF